MSPKDLTKLRNWQVVLTPHIIREDGSALVLPFKYEIKWTPQIGYRFKKARHMHCPRIDRRTNSFKHPECYSHKPCNCKSQKEVARQLGVSQSAISRLEAGKRFKDKINIERLYSVFGEDLLYILAGANAVKSIKSGSVENDA